MAEQRGESDVLMFTCRECGNPTGIVNYKISDKTGNSDGLEADLNCGCKTTNDRFVRRCLAVYDGVAYERNEIHRRHLAACPCGQCTHGRGSDEDRLCVLADKMDEISKTNHLIGKKIEGFIERISATEELVREKSPE